MTEPTISSPVSVPRCSKASAIKQVPICAYGSLATLAAIVAVLHNAKRALGNQVRGVLRPFGTPMRAIVREMFFLKSIQMVEGSGVHWFAGVLQSLCSPS